MIDFRYHLVSIVAVFLALATGIVLGAGPLDSPFDEALASESGESKSELRSELDDSEALSEFQDGVLADVGADRLRTALDDRTVTIFQLPGADGEAIKGLQADVEAAGGKVTGTVEITDKLLDPGQRQLAEGVADQSLAGVKGLGDTGSLSSYELVGTALARAYVTSEKTEGYDGSASTIVSALGEAGFVKAGDEPDSRSNLAVFVAGTPDDTSDDGAGEVLASIAGAVDAESKGAVVAGPVESAEDGGIVAGVRSSDQASDISTVDTVTVPAGQFVTALALENEIDEKSGQYGIGEGADSAVPSAD